MCGIFAYLGNKQAGPIITEGLKKLEYRGYDSWGIALLHKDKIEVTKRVGSIRDFTNLVKLPNSNLGIGHTRWATHGGVTELNAHPHFSTDKSFVVAQNGIVENYQELKESLKKRNYLFNTETDTEVIVRLLESKLKETKNQVIAVTKTFRELEGRNTIIVLFAESKKIIAIRNGSPLIIGINDNEYFFSSDYLSFADKTKTAIFVENNEIIECSQNKLTISNIKTGKKKKIHITKLNQKETSSDKKNFSFYMLKEILEQEQTIQNAISYKKTELDKIIRITKAANKVYITGAGTAGYAAGQIAYYLRTIAKIDARELKSYEISSYLNILEKKDLLIVVSQSGETADSIEALEIFKKKGIFTVGLINSIGSTISKIADMSFNTRSGPEICVASTKAFTAQVAWGINLALAVVGKDKNIKLKFRKFTKELHSFFSKESLDRINKLAKKFADKKNCFILGKDQNYYIALEAALKIKEITYKHFEGFTAGELKHGVIALIEKDTLVFVILPEKKFRKDILSAAAEASARGAIIIGFGKGNSPLCESIINTPGTDFLEPLGIVIAFQLFAYYLAINTKLNPDKPRNLAKSVTVK